MVDWIDIVFLCLLISQLIFIAVIDWKTQRIPNVSILALIATWAIWQFFAPTSTVLTSIICALALGGACLLLSYAFERITGKFAIGGGDIKLIATMGLYLGMAKTLTVVLIACFLFMIFALAKGKRLHDKLAFGPALVASWVVCIISMPLFL